VPVPFSTVIAPNEQAAAGFTTGETLQLSVRLDGFIPPTGFTVIVDFADAPGAIEDRDSVEDVRLKLGAVTIRLKTAEVLALKFPSPLYTAVMLWVPAASVEMRTSRFRFRSRGSAELSRPIHAEGAKVILTARDPERLKHAATEVRASSTAAFDATDPVAIERFFRDLPMIDHVMVTAGRPYYGRLADMDFAKIRDLIGEHLLQALYVARSAANKVKPGGTLIFMGGTGGRRPAFGMSIAGSVTAALPNLTANLALEIAPVRVNVIAAGFVDTPLSAELLGDQLDKRRNQLRTTLPIGRVVGPADVAALAVHIMTSTALTGATYDIDGGQQFVAA